MKQVANERFWSKVNKNGPNGCWIWIGSSDGRYGQFRINGKLKKAHRVAWLFTYGDSPDGKMACHKCDNPACVNPDHIFWGTMSDNILDAVKKGRHKHGGSLKTHCKRGHLMAGENLKIRPATGGRLCVACRNLHNAARHSDAARAALKGVNHDISI